MIGLDGNTYGNCILYPGDSFNCNDDLVIWANRQGVRKFRCLTHLSVEQIEAAYWN